MYSRISSIWLPGELISQEKEQHLFVYIWKKIHFGYRSTPLFEKGGGVVLLIRDGVYGARCGS